MQQIHHSPYSLLFLGGVWGRVNIENTPLVILLTGLRYTQHNMIHYIINHVGFVILLIHILNIRMKSKTKGKPFRNTKQYPLN